MGVIMSSVRLDQWGVERSGVGCVVRSMMILGKWGIRLTRGIVPIICENWLYGYFSGSKVFDHMLLFLLD